MHIEDRGYQFSDGGAGDVAVRMEWAWLEPGFYAGVAARPTEMRVRAHFTVDGVEVDTVEFYAAQGADIYHPSAGQRMRNCAENIGGQMVEFLGYVNAPPK